MALRAQVHALALLFVAVLIARGLAEQGVGRVVLAHVHALLGLLVAGFLGQVRAVLVVAQGVKAVLRGAEGGVGIARQRGLGLAVIALLDHFRGVGVVAQLLEGLARGRVIQVVQLALRHRVAVPGQGIEVTAGREGRDEQQAQHGDQHTLVAAVLLLGGLLLLGLLLLALRLGGALLLFLGGLALGIDLLDHRLVIGGKDPMLGAQAAGADLHARGIRPAADAGPHLALVRGVHGRVRARQLPEDRQALRVRRRGQGVFRHVGGAPAPDRAVFEPDLLHQQLHAAGVDALLDLDGHLERAAGRRLQALHPFHVAGGLLAVLVIAQVARLDTDDRLIGQII